MEFAIEAEFGSLDGVAYNRVALRSNDVTVIYRNCSVKLYLWALTVMDSMSWVRVWNSGTGGCTRGTRRY